MIYKVGSFHPNIRLGKMMMYVIQNHILSCMRAKKYKPVGLLPNTYKSLVFKE